MHAAKKDDELGLPEIEQLVLIPALRNGLKADNSEDPATRAVMATERCQKDLERYSILLRLHWSVTLEDVNKHKDRIKKNYIKRWKEHQVQGQGVEDFVGDPVANEWLKRTMVLKPSLVTKAIKLRTDTAGTGWH